MLKKFTCSQLVTALHCCFERYCLVFAGGKKNRKNKHQPTNNITTIDSLNHFQRKSSLPTKRSIFLPAQSPLPSKSESTDERHPGYERNISILFLTAKTHPSLRRHHQERNVNNASKPPNPRWGDNGGVPTTGLHPSPMRTRPSSFSTTSIAPGYSTLACTRTTRKQKNVRNAVDTNYASTIHP